ncbi:MAG: hypothetical protein HY926_15160 [Elusimicrobia bacterium]|nr:hypothetical protein [Elusimicrobiota bacterium]
MPRNWSRAVLAALALSLCAAAPAPDGRWRKQPVEKLFDCEFPKDWSVKPLTSEAAGFVLTDGVIRISAVRHEGRQARFADPQAFLKDAEALGGPLKKLGMTEVAQRNCVRYQRRSERRPRAKGRESAEYLYEEFVLRPDVKGFWALKLQSASRVYLRTPRGLEEWKRFLATFRPLGPPS